MPWDSGRWRLRRLPVAPHPAEGKAAASSTSIIKNSQVDADIYGTGMCGQRLEKEVHG
jgi:hypothetical protein